MRKKVLALVLALVMVVAMLPTVAFAADLTDINELAKKLDPNLEKVEVNTDSKTIKLKGDITGVDDLYISVPGLTLDLDQYSITLNHDCSLVFKDNATITGQEDGKITQASGSSNTYGSVQINAGTLNLTGGTITVAPDSPRACVLVYSGGTGAFNMSGGTLEGNKMCLQVATGRKATISGTAKISSKNGGDMENAAAVNVTGEGASLTMTGGTIDCTGLCIQADQGASVTVEDGKIVNTSEDGTPAVVATTKGTFNMTGGEITTPGQAVKVSTVTDDEDGTQSKGTKATIGGTAKITRTGERPSFGLLHVEDYCELNIEDSAVIKDTIVVFKNGTLNVKGGTITSEGHAIGTNGSESTDAVINITGGTITGGNESCGVYLPAGKLTVSGNDTVIKGGAGIVVRGGTLDVKGGTIEATGTGEITVGDSGDSVKPAGIAVDKNSGYNNGQNTVTVSGENTVVKAAEGQPAISYSEQGVTENKIPDGKDNKIEVSGGTFKTGEVADKSVSSYTAADTIIGEDGTPSEKLYVEAFGYGATKEEAIEGAMKATGKEKGDKWFSDWNDQTMWVVFNQKIPEGKFVIVTVKDPLGDENIQMLCNGGSDGFAWSYLNNEQTPNTGIVSGSYSIKAEVYEGTYDVGDEENPGAAVTVEADPLTVAAPAKPEVYPAILGNGTEKQPTGNDTSVTAAKSSAVGDYFEVHFTTEGLQKTGQNGASGNEKYYLGFAVEAPSGATKFEYRIGADEKALLGKQWTSQAQLEKNVTTDGKEGVAYYVEAKGTTVANPWIQIRWQKDDGTIRIDTYKIVIDEISFVVAGVEEFAFVDFGFKADAAEANAAINEASKEVNPALEDDVTDAGTNTMYVVFKGKATGSTQTIYAKFTSGQNSNEGTVELTNTSNGGRMYFSFDNAEQVSQTKFAAGEYTVDLYAAENAQDSSKLLGSKSLTIYNVKFEAGEGGTFTNQDDHADVLATKDDAKNITKPAVTAPEGKILSSWKESVDETTYTITYTAQYTTPSAPPTSGGTVTPSATVTTPASTNGSYTVSDKNAKAGDTVTITPKADEGYTVDTVVVTDKDGKDVTVTDNGDGTYSFVMPEKASQPVTVKVTFAKVAPSAKFVDVPQTAWYAEYVDYVVANGLMEGTSDTIFSPNMTTNRAMLVTILYRLEGKPAVTKDIPFSDVAAGEWYSDAINWAAANEIVNGYGDDTFRPLRELSREEAAAILYRYAEYKEYDVTATDDLAGYTDAETVSTWADTAMSWAVAEGIIKGTSETKLTPDGTAIRAQAAAMLTRFCENVAK